MTDLTWKQRAEKLWQIIDDIDTYSDMAKSDDKLYRGLVERKQKERFAILTSDGYNLYLPGQEPPPRPEVIANSEMTEDGAALIGNSLENSVAITGIETDGEKPQ